MWMKFLVSLVVTTAVFVMFVPGVLVTIPPQGPTWAVLLVHGVLFALLNHFIMRVILGAVKSV